MADEIIIRECGEDEGQVVLSLRQQAGEFYRLTVSPEVRRRGVARMLVGTAEKWMAEQGCHRITALVEKDHHWATGFWTAAGYELHESMRRYFRDV